jgi:hypothetical protein
MISLLDSQSVAWKATLIVYFEEDWWITGSFDRVAEKQTAAREMEVRRVAT